jgi:hypothetical protein
MYKRIKKQYILLVKAALYRCFLFVEISLNVFMQSHKHLFANNYTKLFMRKKKSGKKIDPKEPKSRAQYQCLPEVDELIKKVNLVPFPTDMVNLEFEIEHRTRILREKTGDSSAGVSLKEVLLDCLAGLPDEFLDYLKGFCYGSWLRSIDINKADFRDIHHISRAYIEFQRVRGETIYYARRLKNDREGISRPDNWEMFPMIASGTILKAENGNNYVEGLAGVIHKIIPDRFRMCEICNRIFWANYKNSFTCSKPCLNALRQRRHRKTNKEAINEKRRANYDRNKKLKQLKEKKNVII